MIKKIVEIIAEYILEFLEFHLYSSWPNKEYLKRVEREKQFRETMEMIYDPDIIKTCKRIDDLIERKIINNTLWDFDEI